MKYYHPDQLAALVRKHHHAKKFVERACRGLVCRVRYRKMLEAKALQVDNIAEALGKFQDLGDQVVNKVTALTKIDVKNSEKAKWLKESKEFAYCFLYSFINVGGTFFVPIV